MFNFKRGPERSAGIDQEIQTPGRVDVLQEKKQKEMNLDSIKKAASFVGSISFVLAALINLAREASDERYTRQQAYEIMQREAALSGHAQWVTGPDGTAVFVWKDCKH
jgi:hypothetical protein